MLKKYLDINKQKMSRRRVSTFVDSKAEAKGARIFESLFEGCPEKGPDF